MCTLPTPNGLTYVLGEPEAFCARPLPPFAPMVRQFLSVLSGRLFPDARTKTMPDVMAFAWWCRKANLERLAAHYESGSYRLGRGMALHITPTNMPVNFAFSWVFSLLAGNANLVKLPNRDFPQVSYLLEHIESVLEDECFAELRGMNRFVRYGREEEVNASLSAIADVRIIWGGDDTIRTIRKAPLPPRSIDIGFSDRYSFCVLGAAAIMAADQATMSRLVSGFFNDAYIMDQNACSSPRLIVWLGSEVQIREAGQLLWSALGVEATRRYELAAVTAMDKFTQACRDAIELDCIRAWIHEDNRVVRVQLENLPAMLDQRRGSGGYFYEYSAESLEDLCALINSKFQTLTYFGVDKDELGKFVVRNRLSGVDRIVPVGEALDIGLVWDGYDLIWALSRVCDVR